MYTGRKSDRQTDRHMDKIHRKAYKLDKQANRQDTQTLLIRKKLEVPVESQNQSKTELK